MEFQPVWQSTPPRLLAGCFFAYAGFGVLRGRNNNFFTARKLFYSADVPRWWGYAENASASKFKAERLRLGGGLAPFIFKYSGMALAIFN